MVIQADVFLVKVQPLTASAPATSLLFLFQYNELDTSHAISMNVKSIQIKSKVKDTILGPLILLDAALFGALCW